MAELILKKTDFSEGDGFQAIKALRRQAGEKGLRMYTYVGKKKVRLFRQQVIVLFATIRKIDFHKDFDYDGLVGRMKKNWRKDSIHSLSEFLSE
jgi:hypothetical protein